MPWRCWAHYVPPDLTVFTEHPPAPGQSVGLPQSHHQFADKSNWGMILVGWLSANRAKVFWILPFPKYACAYCIVTISFSNSELYLLNSQIKHEEYSVKYFQLLLLWKQIKILTFLQPIFKDYTWTRNGVDKTSKISLILCKKWYWELILLIIMPNFVCLDIMTKQTLKQPVVFA